MAGRDFHRDGGIAKRGAGINDASLGLHLDVELGGLK